MVAYHFRIPYSQSSNYLPTGPPRFATMVGWSAPWFSPPGHLKLTLRLLALKATENGSDRLDEEDANHTVEFGGAKKKSRTKVFAHETSLLKMRGWFMVDAWVLVCMYIHIVFYINIHAILFLSLRCIHQYLLKFTGNQSFRDQKKHTTVPTFCRNFSPKVFMACLRTCAMNPSLKHHLWEGKKRRQKERLLTVDVSVERAATWDEERQLSALEARSIGSWHGIQNPSKTFEACFIWVGIEGVDFYFEIHCERMWGQPSWKSSRYGLFPCTCWCTFER